jgi:hypothetical protein
MIEKENDKFYRYEFKYRIPNCLKGIIEGEFIRMGFADDQHLSENNFYYVTSLYFDSFDYGDYFDKASGLNRRKKIRARVHARSVGLENKPIWLEIKHKKDMRVFKERVALSKDQWDNFSNLRNGDDPVLKKALYYILSENRKPVALVRYKRRPYLFNMAGFDGRFTFDYDIETRASTDLDGNKPMLRVAPNFFVLEVKFDRFLPPWFDFIVKKYNLKRDTFSKYALAVDMIRKFNPMPK